MEQSDRMKLARQASNGRMCLLCGGLFLIFTAVTSTIMYGINFFMMAIEADKGTEEYVEILENAGVGSGLLKGVGLCFAVLGIWEIVAGVLSVKNANRVDKSRFTVKLSISLLVTELLVQAVLFFLGLMNLGLLFNAVVFPLFLLWGATRLGKVAKADPDRVYAVTPAKKKAPQPAAPKKSIRERAAMQAQVETEESEKQNAAGELPEETAGTVTDGQEE